MGDFIITSTRIRITLDPLTAEKDEDGNYIIKGDGDQRKLPGIEFELLVDQELMNEIGMLEAIKRGLSRFDKTKGVKTVKVI